MTTDSPAVNTAAGRSTSTQTRCRGMAARPYLRMLAGPTAPEQPDREYRPSKTSPEIAPSKRDEAPGGSGNPISNGIESAVIDVSLCFAPEII
ncbi:hypothetical protein R1flu_002241 [Riccia fluitans]|uniref:Uncharacterized protein n=1 Tax=Riccia fluitans TaxID=41844 RepID=A0ABD1Y5Y3_9MARC